jgi:lambda repressor-like predicted transcriptional regulator
MVIKRSSILERLHELDTVLQELRRYQHVDAQTLQSDLSQRWIVERGLIAAATLII